MALATFVRLVALPHTVFALPFALASFLIAFNLPGNSAVPRSGLTLVLVILCLVSARTAAMAFNRLVDAKYDALNPRTENRELPQGKLSVRAVILLVIIASSVFLWAAGLIGRHCLVLAPFVLLFLLGYSFTKRYTAGSHFVLGLALALAPGGAWWVVRPEVSIIPIAFMGTVLCWVAGFDILYSLQDLEFDRLNALYSFPARYGIKTALVVSTLLHVGAASGFVFIGWILNYPTAYFLGVAVLSVLLLGQHLLVTSTDFSRINHAFFTFNGLTSIGYFLLVALMI